MANLLDEMCRGEVKTKGAGEDVVLGDFTTVRAMIERVLRRHFNQCKEERQMLICAVFAMVLIAVPVLLHRFLLLAPILMTLCTLVAGGFVFLLAPARREIVSEEARQWCVAAVKHVQHCSESVNEEESRAHQISTASATLKERIAALLDRPHYSMLTALAAGLPVRTIVTTNFDTLAEKACEGISVKDDIALRKLLKSQGRTTTKKKVVGVGTGRQAATQEVQHQELSTSTPFFRGKPFRRKAFTHIFATNDSVAGGSETRRRQNDSITGGDQAQHQHEHQHQQGKVPHLDASTSTKDPLQLQPLPLGPTTATTSRTESSCRVILPPSLSVLPYQPVKGARRVVMKLHGCISRPEELVITTSDYAVYESGRMKALGGFLQGSLMTSHFLFLGFSMTDPNYLRMLAEVREALAGSGSTSTEGAKPSENDDLVAHAFATTNSIRSHQEATYKNRLSACGMATTLSIDSWGVRGTQGPLSVNSLGMHPEDGDVFGVEGSDKKSEKEKTETNTTKRFSYPMILEAARCQEVFLDLVSLLGSAQHSARFVLDDRFDSVLSNAEREFKEGMLRAFGGRALDDIDHGTDHNKDTTPQIFSAEAQSTHGYQEVVRMMRQLGFDKEVGGRIAGHYGTNREDHFT
ncbi:unnamed protein product [Amoebophrya sp. A25]|nr:unnamed protein product [Amoebophrya sp. A25]|eukprot:GSA25T00010312001.1